MAKSKNFAADIKRLEEWLDLAEELQPILSQKAKDLENAIFAKDFKQIEQVALDFSELDQIYYNSVGYNAWSKLMKEIDKILGESADDPMRSSAALSSISNWTIQSGNLWAIVSEANKQDEIEIDDVVADSKMILKGLKKDIANIPKMIKWLEGFLLEAAADTEKSIKAYKAEDTSVDLVQQIIDTLYDLAKSVTGRGSGDPVAVGKGLEKLNDSITKEGIAGAEALTIQAEAYVYGLKDRLETLSWMMINDAKRFSNLKWAELILEVADKDVAELLKELKRASNMRAEEGTPELLEKLQYIKKQVSGGEIYPDELEHETIPLFKEIVNDKTTPAGIVNLLNKAIDSMESIFKKLGSAAGSAGDRFIEQQWRKTQDLVEEAIIRLNKAGIKRRFSG